MEDINRDEGQEAACVEVRMKFLYPRMWRTGKGGSITFIP